MIGYGLYNKSLEERNKLVEQYINLVPWILHTKLHINDDNPYYDDLLGLGNLYLVISANKYDESIGEFSTYATKCIYAVCLKYYSKYSHLRLKHYHHKIPIDKAKELGILDNNYERSSDNQFTNISNAKVHELLNEHPEWLSAETLSKDLNITYRNAFSMIMTLYPFIDLDEEILYDTHEDDGFTVADYIEDPALLREFNDVVNDQSYERLVNELLTLVKPKHKQLVREYLEDIIKGEPHTQDYYGRKYHKARQHIGQILIRYRSKFKDYLLNRKDEFYE